ncbi:MAG: DUF1566 domain-containing protein [Comamonadaceae bacterium]|mgnify:CR=1 FL=1|nr:DUF1566 domain-containing protein [Comamonadaceae bacterium]MBN9366459.1 DUF1566 domain-containing protein [Comamonadaceae bacterium]
MKNTWVLLALAAPLLAQAQETCGGDAATAPNHGANYIVEGDTAMHWSSGLVWQRCPAGMTVGDTCTGEAWRQSWNDWMTEAMPRPYGGMDLWWGGAAPLQEAHKVDRLVSGAWRMPYRNEMVALATGCTGLPRLNRQVFPLAANGVEVYWSGSPAGSNQSLSQARYIGISAGSASLIDRSTQGALLFVRGGQPFNALVGTASAKVAAGVQHGFAAVTLASPSGTTAWGGARIEGEGSPQFQRNGAGAWRTEAIVQTGDKIAVRFTAGAAGSSRQATLSLRSGLTGGTEAYPINTSTETTAVQETQTRFTLGVAQNGACGSALGQPTLVAPSANLCSTGTPSAVGSAAAGYTWQCAGLQGGTTASCSAPRQYPVTATASPASGGNTAQCSPNPATHYSVATCTATPGPGYDFTGWAGDCSGSGACTPVVSGATAVTAQFSLKRYPASASADPPGAGAVTCAPNPVPHGASTTCALQPSAWRLHAWAGDCVGQGGPTCTLAAVTAPPTVIARLDTTRPTARPLNDTGALACDTSSGTVQDCHHGRDAGAATGQLTKTGTSADARSGFDFTKIGGAGASLPPGLSLGTSPGDWVCTRDNVTGLVWEVKIATPGMRRNQDYRYTWHDPHSPDGNPGTEGSAATCLTAGRCDTTRYVDDVNASNGLCGHKDWRLPTLQELETLVDLGRSGAEPRIDPAYFPNTPAAAYWTATPFAGDTAQAWALDFATGTPSPAPRADALRMRLVRGGQ